MREPPLESLELPESTNGIKYFEKPQISAAKLEFHYKPPREFLLLSKVYLRLLILRTLDPSLGNSTGTARVFKLQNQPMGTSSDNFDLLAGWNFIDSI